MTSMESIRDFLGQKRLAIVGVSRRPNHFSRVIFRELRKQGYDTVPVNPYADEIDGERCYARLGDVHPPVAGAIVMTVPSASADVVRDCAAAGVRRVWLYRGAGSGAVTPEAVESCRTHGIQVVPGECPLMFLPQAGVLHRFHGFVNKITGAYPR